MIIQGKEFIPHGVATKSVGESRQIIHLCKVKSPPAGDLSLPFPVFGDCGSGDVGEGDNSFSAFSREIWTSLSLPFARLEGRSSEDESDGLLREAG